MKEKEILILSRIAALAALGDTSGLKRLAESGSLKKIPKLKIIETVLELHLFAGFPAAIEAFAVLNLARPFPLKPKRAPMSIKNRRLKGTKICRRVYAAKYYNLVQTLERLNPDLSDWILEDGYGKVLARPGLSLVERELIAVAVLAASGWKRQLSSHIRGSLNVGARLVDLWLISKAIAPLIPAANARNLRLLLGATETAFQ